MSEQNPERRNLPAIIETHLPAIIEPPTKEEELPPRRSIPWLSLAGLGVAGVAVYWMFFRGGDETKPNTYEPPMGWLELSGCTGTRSFDGTKWLSLSDDKSAELRELLPARKHEKSKERLSRGEWNYDEASKKYIVSINGETTSYSLLSESDVPGCILVKGNFNAANLAESWFATTDDGPDDEAPPKRR